MPEILKARYYFLDLLKAYAVLMMIQGHTLDAVLNPSDQLTPLYQLLHILRGLTAPAFLMGSGLGLVFSLRKKKDLSRTKLLFQKILRISPILAAGYFLHLPYFSAARILTQSTHADIVNLLQCDILQTIGYTIIILQVIFLFIQDQKPIAVFSFISAIIILMTTPIINQVIKSHLFFVQLLTNNDGSPFPLFPFSAYLLIGVVLGYLFLSTIEKRGILAAKILFITSGILIFAVSNFIHNKNIYLFFFRTGILVALSGFFLIFEEKKNEILSGFIIIGQESFLLYIIHIMIVYGSVINKGFAQHFGKTLNSFQSASLAILLIISMSALGLVWHYLKERNRALGKLIRNSLIIGLFLIFLISG